MDENTFIRELLSPLAGQGALGLNDDAALLAQEGGGLVVSTDLLAEGIHFLPDDPPAGLAAKALRCNLSDLAAMGAVPVAAVFSLARPPHWDEAFLRALVAGLETDLHHFKVELLGGDSSSLPAGASGVLSFTLWGRVQNNAVLRSGASAGETLWVSGTIGDSRIGLGVLRDEAFVSGLSQAQKESAITRYRCPEPRLGLGEVLSHQATALLDISDGLILDATRLAEASGVSLEINAPQVPLSEAGQAVAQNPEALLRLLGGGDDYELLFTAPTRSTETLRTLAQETGTNITSIGRVVPQKTDKRVVLLDKQGSPLSYDPTSTGWQHF